MSPDDSSRSGVAGERSYSTWKQCPHHLDIPEVSLSGSQNLREFSRTYKINVNLRTLLTTSGTRIWKHVSEMSVTQPSNTVSYGDGMAADLIPYTLNTNETGKFGMDVNSNSEAGVALRHDENANIVFLDGHASAESHPQRLRPAAGGGLVYNSWYREFDGSGNRVDEMPLVWSEPGKYQNAY